MQLLVAILVAVGAGIWVYTKLIRSSGGNTKSTLIVCGIVGGGTFVVVYMLAHTFLS